MYNKFIVVVPVYNADKYIEKCLTSILSQSYSNYELVVIDDFSSDNTYNIINQIHCKYNNSFKICRNDFRVGSPVANTAKVIELFSHNPEDIIVTVDGDDFLYNDNVLSYLNNIYQDPSVYMTYGQFIPLSGAYGKFCRPIIDTTKYRKSNDWCASHLRTFKNKLWKRINNADLRDDNGEYYKVAGDAAYMYPLIELCGNKHLRFIDDVLYVYNDLNSENEMKKYRDFQIKTAEKIRSKPVYEQIQEDL